MKKIVWKNKSNGQLCVTIPSGSDIKEGDIIDLNKSSVKKITYIAIVADLFHYGHLQSIQFAQTLSDYNVIGVLTDKAVEDYRAKPIANLKERKAIVSSLNCVDKVIIQNNLDPTENLKKLHSEFPNAEITLVQGDNWDNVPGADYIKKIGGKIVQHPYYERLSNFKIINKIMENKDKFKDIKDFASLIRGKEKSEVVNKTIVSTKADTLKALTPLLKKSKIEKLYSFTVSDWKNNKKKVLKEISKMFESPNIVVRSSAMNEDTAESSMAGFFESVLNVDLREPKHVEEAIKKVINSYDSKESASSFNQVLIQEQTGSIVMSGVIFTRTLENNAPYYVINYDDSTGETDTVTGGIESKALKISRFADPKDIPKSVIPLLESVKEIESIVPIKGLDIEFAINKKGEVIIFQVRPLTTSGKIKIKDSKVKDKVESLKGQFKRMAKRKSHLGGGKTILADMPDWNPAEIIGDNPHHLDYSLYDYIITASAWHEARTSQGYYNVKPAKLVVMLGNKPYVDVRNSFNSFIPSSISQDLRERLVESYLGKLKHNPELQDKVEFEIAHTCYDFCFDDRAKELKGFSDNEIQELKKSLIKLTNNLILDSKNSIAEDIGSVESMDKNRKDLIEKSGSASVGSLIKNSKKLLDDCRDKGTVQFSRLARLGFVGKIILKSLVAKEVIDQKFYDSFMNSLSTVAKGMSEDFDMLNSDKMKKEDFISKYYHLRPGSYDITSLRYDSNPNLVKSVELEKAEKKAGLSFRLDKNVEIKINAALKKEGLKFDAKQLLAFSKSALEAREFSKFEFSKNLSDALEFIASAGEKMGFTRQELAMLDVNDIYKSKLDDRAGLAKSWKELISSKIEEREVNSKVIMPPIIFSEKDFDIVQHYIPRPNYITQKKIEADLVKIDDSESTIPKIEGKIVMIENGDPGYDWVFTRKPAGLITKYGGVASHMAIRCAEFGIPAAIGSGIIFDNLCTAKSVELDCGFKKITAVR